MKNHPKALFFPLCDLHHSPMLRVMLEELASDDTQAFHYCERRDCHRIFRESLGYLDYIDGLYDTSRLSHRECPACRGVLYLAEVDCAMKVETWECAESECDYTEDILSPASRWIYQ